MRSLFTLLIPSCLLFVLPAQAAKNIDIARGDPTPGTLQTYLWSCEDTTVDLSDRKGVGASICLRQWTHDRDTGRSRIEFGLVIDAKKSIDVANLDIELRLDRERGWRKFTVWTDTTPELPVKELPDGLQRVQAGLEYELEHWAGEAAVTGLRLRVQGRGQARWTLDRNVGFELDPALTITPGVAAPTEACVFDEVAPRHAGDVSDRLTSGCAHSRFYVGWMAAGGEGTELKLVVEEADFEVSFDEESLVVRGAESLRTKLVEWSEDEPNPVWMHFDGERLLIQAGGERFGPLSVRRRPEGEESPALKLEMDGRARLSQVVAGPADGGDQAIAYLIETAGLQEVETSADDAATAVAARAGIDGSPTVTAGEVLPRPDTHPAEAAAEGAQQAMAVAEAAQGAMAAAEGVAQFTDMTARGLQDTRSFEHTGSVSGDGLFTEHDDGSVSVHSMGVDGHAGQDGGSAQLSHGGTTVSSTVDPGGTGAIGVSQAGLPAVGGAPTVQAPALVWVVVGDGWTGDHVLKIDGVRTRLSAERAYLELPMVPGRHTFALKGGDGVVYKGTLQLAEGQHLGLAVGPGGVVVDGDLTAVRLR